MGDDRRTYQIQLGAMADPLTKQLEGTIIPEKDLHRFEGLANAITELRFGNILTYSQTENARKRLVSSIFKKAEKLRALSPASSQ